MTTHSYEDRLRRVLRYIHDNPDGDLSLDALADVAAMSRFHWHRVYTAMTGETCAQAVRRVRMHRASFWLVRENTSISEIAKRCGYSNLQSFNRAFREIVGQTPHEFRKSGQPKAADLTLTKGETTMYDVNIVTAPKRRLAALLHKGPYTEIGKSYEELSAMFGARGLFPNVRGMTAVYYSDPHNTAAADLRSHAGFVVEDSFAMPDDLEDVHLGDTKSACLTLKGPYTGLASAYDHLYGAWLAGSGEELLDAPSYEVYLNSPHDTAPEDLVTEIYMPLK